MAYDKEKSNSNARDVLQSMKHIRSMLGWGRARLCPNCRNALKVVLKNRKGERCGNCKKIYKLRMGGYSIDLIFPVPMLYVLIFYGLKYSWYVGFGFSIMLLFLMIYIPRIWPLKEVPE